MTFSKSLKIFEKSIIKSEKLFNLISQIVFLQAAEVCLLDSGQKAASLFTLVLYNCIIFSLKYVHEVITNSKLWKVDTIADSSDVPHLTMSATKLTLEWTKLIVFFMTIICAGMGFILGVTLQNINLTPSYMIITFLYYLSIECTNNIGIRISTFVTSRWCDWWEGEETMVVPIMIKTFSLMVAVILTGLSLFQNRYRVAMTSSIICVYLKYRDIHINGLDKLRKLECTVTKYPLVPRSELAQFDDVCPICLSQMSRARRTYCGHIFHPLCLSRAISVVPACPVCKQSL